MGFSDFWTVTCVLLEHFDYSFFMSDFHLVINKIDSHIMKAQIQFGQKSNAY